MNARKTRMGLLAMLAVVGCGRAQQGSERVGQADQALQTGPDFVVTAVSAPASAELGQSITVQVTVCNQGTSNDSTDVEVYLSADASIHANTSTGPSEDRLLGNAYVPSLYAGQCTTLPISGSASAPTSPPPPSGSLEGPYYVGAVVDPRNSRPELREDNNTTVGNRIGLGHKADFVVTAVSGPASAQSGQSITAQVTVCNQGTVSDSTDVEVYLSADASIHANTSSAPSEDRLIGGGPTPPLNPGQCSTQSVSGSASPPPPSGPPGPDSAWYIGAVVDPRNYRAELIEDNNATAGNRVGVGSLPDFVITSVTAPASVQQGQSLTAQVTVCNQGTSSGSAPFEVYLSADASIHANTSSAPSEDAMLGSGYSPPLNAGQCATVAVSGSAYPPPPSGPPGPDSAWYIGAVVDPRGSQPELREDNNSTAGSRVGVGSLPDFVVTSVTAPASVQQGQNLTAQVTVCNQGTQYASTQFEVYLSADASIHANTSTAPSEDAIVGSGYTSLNPGQCATVAVSGSAYPPPPSGPPGPDSGWYIGAVVDPRGSQPELREDNNATAGARIGVGNLPDFVITSVTAPASVQQGQSLTAQVTVCNQGTSSGSAPLEVYLSADASIHANTSAGPSEDAMLGSGYTSPLNPGQCATVAVSGSAYPPPVSGPPGPDSAWYIGAVVDPRNNQSELREDNNSTAGSRVGVGSLPDFVITSVTAPASVQQGQSLTAQVTVCNQGTQYASTQLEVYLSADASIHANTSASPSEDALLGSGYTSLNPGQCATVAVSGSAYPPPPSGPPGPDSAWYIGAVVDPRNNQSELREDNNSTTGSRVGVGNLPDFVVTSVTAPASVQQGQSLTAQVTVCNQGTQYASTQLEVYLSADASIHANTSTAPSEDAIVGSGYTSLNPGQCATVPVSGSAYPPPPSGPPGPDSAWYIGAVVDPRASQPELREDNNATAGARIGVGNLPDFVITSVTAPASVQQGQSLTAQVTVCNQGSQYASTQLEVYLSADASIHANTSASPSEDALLGSGYTSLNPGQCTTLAVSGSAYPPPPSGPPGPDSAWYIGAVVDPRSTQSELREDNNATAGNRVGVGSLPDFVVTSVTAPASVQQGQSLTAQVTVCNQGTQYASTQFEVYLSADASIHANTSAGPSEDALLGSGYTSLNPGQCTTMPVSGSAYPPPSSSPPGPDSAWYIGAVVDPRSTQSELREDNNSTAGSRIGVGNLPDFVITSVTAPASVQQGQSLTAQVTVCNQGTQYASTQLEVYLSADASIHANTSSTPSEDSLVGSGYTSLNPGQCATVAVSGSAYPPPPSGPPGPDSGWYIGAVVDPRGSQPELREDNNSTAGSRIGVGNKADFVVTSVTGPSSLRMGSSFTATVTVCNRGQVSDSTDVELYFSSDANIHANTSAGPSEDSYVGRVPSVFLAPGVCSTQSLTLSAYVPSSGGYYLGAVADAQNSRSELLEDNNSTAGTFTSITP